jgi:hypothetical protein
VKVDEREEHARGARERRTEERGGGGLHEGMRPFERWARKVGEPMAVPG